jgi:hypothetical protein
MTNREFCIARRKGELPAFLRVLRALPEARLDYKPDEKSKNAAELSGTLIEEEAALAGMIDRARPSGRPGRRGRRSPTSWRPTRRTTAP